MTYLLFPNIYHISFFSEVLAYIFSLPFRRISLLLFNLYVLSLYVRHALLYYILSVSIRWISGSILALYVASFISFYSISRLEGASGSFLCNTTWVGMTFFASLASPSLSLCKFITSTLYLCFDCTYSMYSGVGIDIFFLMWFIVDVVPVDCANMVDNLLSSRPHLVWCHFLTIIKDVVYKCTA